jgi:membrane protease subunit HflC
MSTRAALIGLSVVAALLLVGGATYTLSETEQAIITQFGEPVGGAVATPGLHFKVPFIQMVHRFDKRWIAWDGDANQITTRDKKYIWVDGYARWRISDPLLFYQRVRDERGGQSRLDDIIDGETRNAVANFDLIQVVRSTNRKFEITEDLAAFAAEATQEIQSGRRELMKVILEKAAKVTPEFGIELVDVRLKRINYVDEVEAKVYERMISERKRIAERSRSEGQGRSAEIIGQREKELRAIESEAFKKAEEIRGKADAEAAAIYARAYNKDPEFFQFMKTMEAYRESLGEDVWLVMSSDSEFLSYLRSANGK